MKKIIKILTPGLYIFWILATRPDGEKIWLNNEAIVAVSKYPEFEGCCTLIKTLFGDIRVKDKPEDIMKQLDQRDTKYQPETGG